VKQLADSAFQINAVDVEQFEIILGELRSDLKLRKTGLVLTRALYSSRLYGYSHCRTPGVAQIL